jgi:hypothetical protein
VEAGGGGRGPRTLLLALDAVPYRVFQEARSQGAFADWPAPSALVAPFPSVTHVAFASLFQPLGAAPSDHYELRYFDVPANRIAGGNPVSYGKERPPWSEFLDSPRRSLTSELSNYVSPAWAARRELDEMEQVLFASERDVVVAYVGGTDGIMHLFGDDAGVEFLKELSERLATTARRHLKERGRPLRIALCSDHGCGNCQVRHATGFDDLLREEGFRVVERLERPNDVAAPTFGLVNFGALFLREHDRAGAAALAVARHDAVELAAYSPEPGVIDVVSPVGSARITWRGTPGAESYAYEDHGGDALQLAEAHARLAAGGLLDDDGYASGDDWLRESAFGYFPDPLRRLVTALTGDRVQSRADVLFSLGPSWARGLRSAVVGSWVRHGSLRGTHGGLDRDSTLAFFAVNDPAFALPPAAPSHVALVPFAGLVAAERTS